MKIPALLALRRLGTRHRRLWSALAAGLAVACCAAALAPSTPPSTVVVVATGEIAGGRPLSAADVALRPVPTALVPAGALRSTEQVVGKMVATVITSGSILTTSSVVAHGFGGLSPDDVISSVRITDTALAGLIQVGDLVDVIAPGDKQATTIASRARVLAIPAPQQQSNFASTSGQGAVVLIASPPQAAAAIAQASAFGHVSVVLRA